MASDSTRVGEPASAPAVRQRRGRTLLVKYASYSALLVMALLTASGATTGYLFWREMTAAQEELLSGKAKAVAVHIGSFLDGIEQPLTWTAGSAALSKASDRESVRLELIRLLRRVPSISELRWLDAQGQAQLLVSRLALDEIGAGQDFSNDPRFVTARSSGRFAGTVYFHKGTEPFLSLAIADERRGGVLLAEVNLKFIWDVVAREHIGATGMAYLVDEGGQLISHPDLSRVLRKSNLAASPQVRAALSGAQAAQVDDDRGVAVLVASARVDGWGWTVLAEQPAREAFAPVYRGLARTAWLALLGIAVSIAASVVLARRMVRPIRALERGAERIGAGELDQRIELRSGDELEALAEQFNRMASSLSEIYATLENRIDERTEQLARANDIKTRFLAAASHDLRQPVHALALFVGQLRHAAGDSTPLAPLAQRIEDSVDALRQLLDALLDLSRLDAGVVAPEREDFPVQPLFERLALHMTAAAEEKGLALRVRPTPLWIASDPRLLERILLNLVANAVRYTPCGRVFIGCRRRRNEADIFVADTGVGIAAEHLPHVFREFYQVAKDGSDRSKGLGLGLAIVDRLAHLLGHPVNLRSTPGQGSVFSVRVLLAVAPAAAADPDRREAGDEAARWRSAELAGRQVLVIDDDAAARDALAGLLERWGCAVVAVADRSSALARAALAPPEVVICDLRLGDGDSGFAVLDALRERQGAAWIEVMITADVSADAVRLTEGRACPLLHKPVRPARLRVLLERLLAERPAPGGARVPDPDEPRPARPGSGWSP